MKAFEELNLSRISEVYLSSQEEEKGGSNDSNRKDGVNEVLFTDDINDILIDFKRSGCNESSANMLRDIS